MNGLLDVNCEKVVGPMSHCSHHINVCSNTLAMLLMWREQNVLFIHLYIYEYTYIYVNRFGWVSVKINATYPAKLLLYISSIYKSWKIK